MTSGNATSGHGGWNRLPKEGLVQLYVSLSQRRNRGQAAVYCADVAVRAVESSPWAGVRDACDLWTCALCAAGLDVHPCGIKSHEHHKSACI